MVEYRLSNLFLHHSIDSVPGFGSDGSIPAFWSAISSASSLVYSSTDRPNFLSDRHTRLLSRYHEKYHHFEFGCLYNVGNSRAILFTLFVLCSPEISCAFLSQYISENFTVYANNYLQPCLQ